MRAWESAAGLGQRSAGSFMETLEPRALLAAVTAHMDHAGTNANTLYFQVTYSSDRPIDLASINGDEFRLVKQGGGFDQAPRLMSAEPWQANHAQAWYEVSAPADQNLWAFTDNGRYVLQFAGDSVANSDDEGNAAADIHTFSLWFAGPSLRLSDDNRLDVYGRGFTGEPDPSGRVAVYDEARVDVKYEVLTLPGWYQRPLIATLVGPNGYEQTQRVMAFNNMFAPRAGGGFVATIPVRFTVPGGTWDPSDSGGYALTVKFESITTEGGGPILEPVRIAETYDVDARGVKAEMTSVSITTGEMLVTMRYSHPSGINLATITTGDVKVAIPGQGLFTPSLVGTPQVQGGVVTAVYRLVEPTGGWSGVTGGQVTVRTALGEVRASNGESIGFAVTRTVNVSTGGRVTGVVKSAYTTASKLVVVMRYSSDQAVDASTLSSDDVRLTGPNGYNELGQLIQVVPQANGEVLGVYHFHAPDITWDYRTDNGAYVLSVEPGAVREVNGGDGSVAGNVRTFGLWFNNAPVVEITTPAQMYVGTAVTDTLFDNTDAARVVVKYTTLEPRKYHGLNHAITARITGPNGFSSSQLLPDNWTAGHRSMGWGDVTVVDLRFAPPGGGWDSTDNGQYTITVLMQPTAGNPTTEVLFQQQLNVNIAAPRAELVNMVTSSTAITAVVRYDAPGGVNLATISSADVVLINRINGIGYTNSWATTMTGTMVSPPVAGPNGSVTAIYRFTAPNGEPWLGMANASLVVKPQEVRDNANNPIGAALLKTFSLPPALPDVISTGTLTASRTAWEIEVIIRNPAGLIDTSSLRASNLVVSAPEGRATRVFMTSFVTAQDGTLRVRYKITMPVSGGWLPSGEYTLALAPNSISQGLAGYLPATTLGTFNMTF